MGTNKRTIKEGESSESNGLEIAAPKLPKSNGEEAESTEKLSPNSPPEEEKSQPTKGREWDFKLVFIHTEPEQIAVEAQKLVQRSLESDFFLLEEHEVFVRILSIVAQPKIFKRKDETNPGVEELEPRIEFYLAMCEKAKNIGCVFILEYLMSQLWEKQSELKLNYLRYRAEIPAVANGGIEMPPFKRHFSAIDSAHLTKIGFGNILWHNQLHVHKLVSSDQMTLRQIFDEDKRRIHITTRSNESNGREEGERGRSVDPLPVQNPPKRGGSSSSVAINRDRRATVSGSSRFRRANSNNQNGNSLSTSSSAKNSPRQSIGGFSKSRSTSGTSNFNNLQPSPLEDDSGVALNGRSFDDDEDFVTRSVTPPAEEVKISENTKKDNTKLDKMKGPKNAKVDGGRRTNLGMKFELEHDRQVLSIIFYVPYQPKNKWPTIDKVKLEVRYSAISQVVLALKRRGNKKFAARLMLRMAYPPTIWHVKDVFGMMKFEKGYQVNTKRGNRVVDWLQGPGDDIKDSPVLVLDLQPIEAKIISSMLSRLMVELKISLELRNLIERKAKRPMLELPDQYYDDNELLYWVQALSTRGYVVLDHWIDMMERDHFFDYVLKLYNKNRQKTLDTLEELADKLWDRAEVKHHYGLGGMLEDIWEQMRRHGGAGRNWLKDGYERVKKVVITPSRIVLCGHEVLMGNRVLRFDPNYPSAKFLRIIFRDENLEKLRKNEMNERLIEEFVLKRLIDGIEAGGNHYSFIGTSNSQMRDGGCYFLQADLDEVNAFRNRLGQFARVPTIPKMMSRLGLCFTQGREIGMDMSKRMLGWDFEGGEDTHGNSYTFSDGCGCMSMHAAREIAVELGMDPRNPPSCFQFRYAGYKGVLTVNPVLDSNKSWWDELDVEQREQFGTRENALAVDFFFRPSQKKFDVWQQYEDQCRLEIVKNSAPTIVVLNKPLINILDQVSRMHSHKCHKRICTRVHTLLDRHIFTVCASLTDETVARRRLQELPRLIDYSLLRSVQFTREPFFRLVLRAAAKVSIHKLRQKLAIAIPPSLGRMMFGVIDETGILQSGQIFAQYTEDITGGPDEHHRRKTKKGVDKKRILTGPVMITKNPSIVGGDVRMFEAVDVQALHHLVDVLVFPRYGPRPHSDEMAGSDLDGDEYTLIWDPELALEGNQPAADYSTPKDPTSTADPSSTKENDEIVSDPDKFQREMANFFVNFLRNDSVGQIANSHLANSDLYGIESDVCGQIAIKHSQAVDFPKTGKAPKQLIVGWNEAEDLPPEKYERAPDFMDKGANEPEYVSTRLNSQLYNRIKSLSDFLNRSISDESFQLPETDNLLLSLEDHQEYLLKAAENYEPYDYAVRCLMNTYGIQCEGELFSSSYSSIRNRFSDRENDDMSFYTTTRLIEQRLWDIREAARTAFFTAYGDKMEELVDEDGICQGAPEKLQLLARAYYTICYNSISRKLLSFPWIACWEVLDAVRRCRIVCNANSSLLFRAMFDPFGDNLSDYIKNFISPRRDQLIAFHKRHFRSDGTESEQLLHRYNGRHKGLAQLMFFCVSWADHMGLFRQSALDEEHVCLLLLSYGLLNMPQSVVPTEERRPWLTETPPGWTKSDSKVTQMGRRFCSFVEALASRHFDQMCSLDFVHLGLGPEYCFMCRGEWRPLHRIALDTYQHLVFMDHHERVLPPLSTSLTHSLDADTAESRVTRGDIFVIELPARRQTEWLINEHRLLLRLCEETGCVCVIPRPTHPIPYRALNPIQMRSGRLPRPTRVRVSSWGTRQALNTLRRFFAVSPQLDLTQNRRSRIQILPEQTLEKLDALVNGAMRERKERQGEQGMEGEFMERVEEEAEEELMELEGEIEEEEEVASDD